MDAKPGSAFGANQHARNQLIASTANSASFSYDAVGRRVGKTVSGVTSATLYDDYNPIVMAGSTYMEGLGLDDVLASVNVSTGTVTSYATDAIGSVVGVINSSGTLVGNYSYDSYGNTVASGATSPLQYTGRENDGTYYYNRARYYDPATARFLSEDPLNIGGGSNLYGYADGDPVSLSDPTGLKPGDEFCSADAAAMDAIDYARPLTRKFRLEYGGWVFKNFNGTYSADIRRGGESWTDVGSGPVFKDAAGIWHTHPFLPFYDVNNFSPIDIQLYVDEKVPGYLGAPNGTIKKYIPGKGEVPFSRASCTCK